VKAPFFDEMLARIKTIIDPAKIDYVISNHVEMDHSGGLPQLMQLCPHAEIICSVKGQEGLLKHYKNNWKFKAVTTGDRLMLGKRQLDFVVTPMVHWPDNMVSYCPEEKILFSNDGFGQHIAADERFADEYSLEIVMEEAKKYYANIVLPYGAMVQKELAIAKSLDIAIIAPSHGLIWRSNLAGIIAEYDKWSKNETKSDKGLIIYDTMWHSTELVAKAIHEGFEQQGIKTEMLNLQTVHISDVMTKIIDAKYICVGSPTLNNNMLPTVAAFLTYLKGLSPKNRIGLAFGSYGWGGQSIGQVEAILKECGFELLESVKVNYIPDEKLLADIARKISKK
jgi:flavorubredoxin